MAYEAIIGMEVHVQLKTASKMFCPCDANYASAPPNTHVCPVCLGMPGVLPVINRKAVEFALMTGLALHCEIPEYSKFDRKNYPYPDLVKGYQISQYDMPLARNGWLEIRLDGQTKRIGIRRVHLEEDTGKSTHMGSYSLLDYNRSGVPLMEIVSEPDIRSGEEAWAYLTKLRIILRYLGVSTGNMEEGALRCEPNVSVRPAGSEALGAKVEIKNLNSFRAVRLAIDYEIARQIALLESGGAVQQVTMGWDENAGRTVLQRVKEGAEDYRYFPEPDLPLLQVTREWVEELCARLPELPDARRERFIAAYGLRPYDAELLTAEREIADYFEAAAQAADALGVDPRTVGNWVTGELFRLLRESGQEIAAIRVGPDALAGLLGLIEKGIITATMAKAVLDEMFATGRTAAEIVEAKGLGQIADAGELARVAEEVIAANPKAVREYLDGKEQVLGFLIGQVMRATRGKANPQLAGGVLREKLGK